ncbi:MAG: hypothetical protein JWN57_1030, partial [Frankiales bacterium]|nr:hypothetical protein [Frankiales bacterium]
GDIVIDSAGGPRAQVGLPAAVGEGLDQQATQDGSGATLTLRLNADGPSRVGVFTLALWGASDAVEAWELDVRGATGASLLGHLSGGGAQVFDEQDFTDGAAAVVRQYVPGVGGADAVVQAGARKTFMVRDTLLGFVHRSDLGTTYSSGQVRVSGPATDRTCPCSWTTSLDQEGSGQYTVISSGVSLGADTEGGAVDVLDDRPVGVVGSLADVRVPRGFRLPDH